MTVLTFNRGLSSAVSKEMLLELTEVRNSLPKTMPWDVEIANRFERVARIAKTAQLRSLQKVLSSLARGAHTLNKTPNEKMLDAVQKTLHAILMHLQELVQDHKNTPMKMSKSLQVLLTELGEKVSSTIAAELYLPYIPENTAPARPTELASSEFIGYVKEHRATYRQALVKLIKENDLSQLTIMRQTLLTLEPKNPHIGYRVFFEASIAVFDRLVKTLQLDNIGKWIVGKIDPELERITSGSTHVEEDLLSVILYVVAKAEPESGARMRILQEHFNLKSYLADGADSTVVEKLLTVLVKARELWTQNNNQDITNMAKLVSELNSKSALLKNPGFAHVINALHDVLVTVQNNEIAIPEAQLALEGASALLILEKQLVEGPSMDTAHLAASRLYALIGKQVAGIASDNQTATIILHRLAAEVQEDLDQLEPKILEIFSGHVEAEEEFRVGLNKVAKILRILGKDNPLAAVITTFEKDFRIPDSSDEKASIATKYTQLGSIVDHLKNSEKTAFAAAQKWLDNLEVLDETSAVIEEDENVIDKSNDPEMLEIFLEEAESILIDLDKWQHALKQDLSDHETLINIRRAYHTLKGSGRMVGLSRFGDLSYITELLLNSFIQTKKIPSKDLLAFIVESTARVTKHIADFNSPAHVSKVYFDDLEEKALALGGTALADAPQTKELTQKLTPVKPVVKSKPVTVAPVIIEAPIEPAIEEPVIVIEEPVIVIEEPIELAIEEPVVVIEAPIELAIEEPVVVIEAPIELAIEEPIVVIEAPIELAIEEPPVLSFEKPPVVIEAPIELAVEEPVVIIEEPTVLTFEEPPVVIEEPMVLTFETPITHTESQDADSRDSLPSLPDMDKLKLKHTAPIETHIDVIEEKVLSPIHVEKVSEKPVVVATPIEAPVRRKHRETPEAWKQHAHKTVKAEPTIHTEVPEVIETPVVKVTPPEITNIGFFEKLLNMIKGLFGKKP